MDNVIFFSIQPCTAYSHIQMNRHVCVGDIAVTCGHGDTAVGCVGLGHEESQHRDPARTHAPSPFQRQDNNLFLAIKVH